MPLTGMPHRVLEWQKAHVGLSTRGPHWNRLSAAHGGLSQNVCRAVSIVARSGNKGRTRIFLQNFEQPPMTCRQVCFDKGGIFSLPVTHPRWWFDSSSCLIAFPKLFLPFCFLEEKKKTHWSIFDTFCFQIICSRSVFFTQTFQR